MIINKQDGLTYLLAEPNKFLTDGEIYCSTVILPPGANALEWYEITAEEKERMEAEQNVLFK